MLLPAAADTSWSVSIMSSQATGIISANWSSDRIGAALDRIPKGHWVNFWA